MPTTLDLWNSLTAAEAATAVLPCNGSAAWADALAELRPFASVASVYQSSDDVWLRLPAHDKQQAFDSHPRIGEQKAKAATAASLSWSAGEQSGVDPTEALAQGNRAYEAKFGCTFLICATGKSAADILAELQRRMSNDSATELEEASEQQRQITQLRLRKWLQAPAHSQAFGHDSQRS